MKTLIALALVLACSPVFAADKAAKKDKPKERDPKEMAQKMTDHLKEALDLSDDQAKKVGSIMDASAGEEQALTKKLREIERAKHEKIRAVLNDEQKEKFDMMRAHRMMMMRGGGMMGHGRGGRGGRKGPPQQDNDDDDRDDDHGPGGPQGGNPPPPPHDDKE